MKHGFLLIDVLLAVTLSAVMLTSLYQCLYQTSVLTRRVESTIEYGTMWTLFSNQIEKDISSAFVPREKKEAEPVVSPKSPEDAGSQQEKKPPVQAESDAKETDEKFFFAEKDTHGFTGLFTCITTNRLKIYGQEVPTLGRIVYKLAPMKEKELYALTRQEATQEDLKAFDDGKKIRAHTIIDSLKKYTLTFIVVPEEEKDESKKTAAPEKTASFDVWNDEIQKKTKRKIPDFVEIRGIYWDALQKREREFNIRVPIAARYWEEKKQEQKKDSPKPVKQSDKPVEPQPQPIMGAL